MNLILIILGKLIINVSKIFNFGSGSTWPGHIALTLNGKFIEEIVNKNKSLKIIIIAGTNGKTTSTALLKYLLEKSGHRVFTNNEGANLLNGVASTIIKNSDVFSKLKFDFAILESDELNLPLLLNKISPDKVLILNLFRDQLDRYGEVNTIALKWLESLKKLAKKTEIIINGDDPQLYYIGTKLTQKVNYFGIDKELMKLKDIPNDVDSIYCPNCLSLLKYHRLSYAHLGDFYCSNCKFKRFGDVGDFSNIKINYPMSGLYNVYNTNAVLLLIKSLIDIKTEEINKWLAYFIPAFGRQEEIIYKNRKVFILLSKNPAGFNQSIQTLSAMAKSKKSNFLIILNNRIPDGLDVSWIWDVDFKPIFDVASNIFVSGDRLYDLNLRLKYENDKDIINTYEDLSAAVESIVSKTKEEEMLYILPTYSAMLEVRKILTGKKI
ncbi:MAG: MurT ligase domain-containing protein [Patescibacteria group bacterium]|jgi:UDP-N-acetylmuramyl tripeptide synthase